MTLDKITCWTLGAIGVAHVVMDIGETYDWFGDPAAPHFTHGSALWLGYTWI